MELGGGGRLALNPWLLMFAYTVLVVIALAPVLLVPLLIHGRTRDPLRTALVESGQVPQGEARRRYVMQYYPFMLMFVALDVIAMFLLAWSAVFLDLGLTGSILVLLFVIILVVPLVYSLRLATRRELW